MRNTSYYLLRSTPDRQMSIAAALRRWGGQNFGWKMFRLSGLSISGRLDSLFRKPSSISPNKDVRIIWCVLNHEAKSRIKHIVKPFIPEGWVVRCHHVTIYYREKDCTGPSDFLMENHPAGKKIESIQITHIGWNDAALAIKVEGIRHCMRTAHVTVAVEKNSEAVASNQVTAWIPLPPAARSMRLRGVVRHVMWKKKSKKL